MTKVYLSKNTILQLLAEADMKWYNSHSGKFNYREYLEFVADYISKKYRYENSIKE